MTRRSVKTTPLLPFEQSVGYQIRMAHRAVQRRLQAQIAPHGVTPGMWYFLRVLWAEDGLTQSEISRRVGTMDPTTLTAISAIERAGFVRRERDAEDSRKIRIFLTPAGEALRTALLPEAVAVVDAALKGFTPEQRQQFLDYLAAVQRNLETEAAAPARAVKTRRRKADADA
jgi:DNA-binding MarR family transcriptional regulator